MHKHNALILCIMYNALIFKGLVDNITHFVYYLIKKHGGFKNGSEKKENKPGANKSG